MKALSLRPEWAMPVMSGAKTIECRSWKTDYRGDLLICSSSKRMPGAIDSHAVCVVTLAKIERFCGYHLRNALMDDYDRGSYAWHLKNVRLIEPFKVKGKLHLYTVDDSLIRFLPERMSASEALKRYYEPLVYWGRNEKKARAVWHEFTGL